MKELFKQLIEENPNQSTVKLVYKCLYEKIIALDMPPGSKINLSKISSELNVSSTTVRDAALMLLDDNLAQMQYNQGFFVSKLDVKELNDIVTARKIIETNASKILCEKISKEQLDFLHNILDLMKNSLQKNEYGNFMNLDIAFHSSIVNFSDNKYIILMFESIIDTLKRYGKFLALNLTSDTYSRLKTSYRQHVCILNSLENSMIDNVDILLQKHLNDFDKLIYFSKSNFDE